MRRTCGVRAGRSRAWALLSAGILAHGSGTLIVALAGDGAAPVAAHVGWMTFYAFAYRGDRAAGACAAAPVHAVAVARRADRRLTLGAISAALVLPKTDAARRRRRARLPVRRPCPARARAVGVLDDRLARRADWLWLSGAFAVAAAGDIALARAAALRRLRAAAWSAPRSRSRWSRSRSPLAARDAGARARAPTRSPCSCCPAPASSSCSGCCSAVRPPRSRARRTCWRSPRCRSRSCAAR